MLVLDISQRVIPSQVSGRILAYVSAFLIEKGTSDLQGFQKSRTLMSYFFTSFPSWFDILVLQRGWRTPSVDVQVADR